MPEFYHQIVSGLQASYNSHRPLELNGTRELSPFFFTRAHQSGPIAAWTFIVNQQRAIGNPHLAPEVKAALNLAGSIILATGVREVAGISHHGRLVSPYRDNYGKKIPLRQRAAEIAFNFALTMLFTVQDGPIDMVEFPNESMANEHRKAGHRQIDMFIEEGIISPEKAERLHRQFDRNHGWK